MSGVHGGNCGDGDKASQAHLQPGCVHTGENVLEAEEEGDLAKGHEDDDDAEDNVGIVYRQQGVLVKDRRNARHASRSPTSSPKKGEKEL